MLWVLGNAFAKWHHQLRVRGMILHVHSVMLWKTTSEPDTCTQESKGKVVSFPSAKSQFGKWLKKPFFTLMSQRLIDLMRTRLFYERNFIGQLASMEEMERYVFLWRDLRLVGPKNHYCLSNNMSIQNFIFKFAQRNSNIWEICGCRTKSRESWLGPKSLFSLTLRLEVCSISGNYFKTVIQYSGWAIFGVCPR